MYSPSDVGFGFKGAGNIHQQKCQYYDNMIYITASIKKMVNHKPVKTWQDSKACMSLLAMLLWMWCDLKGWDPSWVNQAYIHKLRYLSHNNHLTLVK
jgi:hypothetical protein